MSVMRHPLSVANTDKIRQFMCNQFPHMSQYEQANLLVIAAQELDGRIVIMSETEEE
jgi:hypothetical protein